MNTTIKAQRVVWAKDDHTGKKLTVGKEYQTLVSHFGNDRTIYCIEDDEGSPIWVNAPHAVGLDEWREKKLNDIGIL